MTAIEAARKIGISASKLYQLASSHRISHYRIGGKILFEEQDIAAFMAGCRVEAAMSTPVTPRRMLHLKHLKLA